MSHWKTYQLKELCTDIIDCVNKTAPISNVATPYKMLRTSDIRDGRINLDNLNCVTLEVFQKWTRRGMLQVGDVILTREAPLGEVGLVRIAENYFLGQRLVLFRVNRLVCDNRFLIYSFLFHDNKQSIIAKGVGATVLHLRVPECEKIEIKIPELPIQHRIANILSTYDDLIENNQKQIRLLEEAVQRLYKEWFVDLRFPGYEDTPIVGGVPEGWALQPLYKVFTYVRDKSYTSKELSETEGILMVNLKNIKAFGGYNRNAEKRFVGKHKEEQQLKPGDIIMGVTDMTQERRLVGHVAMVPDTGENMTFSMDLIKLIPLSLKKSFLYSALSFGEFSKKIAPLANGVNVLHLNPESMMNMEILIPSSKIIEQYDVLFEAYQKRIEKLQSQCDFAVEARERLLPKLMGGEVEV